MTINTSDVTRMRGLQVVDRDGDKIGKVDEIYLDQQTNKPEWLAVKTGLFGSNVSFIPLAEATTEDDVVRVPFEKAHVKDAPNADPDGELTQEEEARLYRHYGLDYGESRSDSGLPEGRFDETGRTDSGMTGAAGTTGTTDAGFDGDRDFDRDRDVSGTVGHDTSGPTTDDAMTRSEEELSVGTTQREAGRARLRKYVVTDEVTETVPVRREEVRIEREPITDANVGDAMDGPELSEEEHEVVLNQEEVVAEKRVVPKERVRLDKDVEVEERTVSEDVRREEIEVDDEGTRGTR
jgi:uncharacterized protein (TIGR02271 family)